MRLSELKKLVDAATEQAAKHQVDPEVGFYGVEDSSGDYRHKLVSIEHADIVSVSNLKAHSTNLIGCHEIDLSVPMKSLFILSDDADEEVFH